MFFTLKIKIRRALAVFICLSLIGLMCAFAFNSKSEKSKNKSEGIFVPIIMYHSILKDEARRGEYVVSPTQVEEDFIYLKENGYTPVFVNDLIRYVNYGGELPDKPVVITADDGTYNNYTYLLPLLEKYDFKATISIVGSYTVQVSESGDEPNANYSYLRWQDINEMRDSGLVEFCNHTYDLHNLGERKGISQIQGESYTDYRKLVLNDLFNLQQLFETNCQFRPNVFTYPFGATCENACRLVKNCGFEASLGVEEKPNYIQKNNSDCLYNLNRYNRSGFDSTENFMERLLNED